MATQRVMRKTEDQSEGYYEIKAYNDLHKISFAVSNSSFYLTSCMTSTIIFFIFLFNYPKTLRKKSEDVEETHDIVSSGTKAILCKIISTWLLSFQTTEHVDLILLWRHEINIKSSWLIPCVTHRNWILKLLCRSKFLILLAPPIYYDRINNDLQSVTDIRNDP